MSDPLAIVLLVVGAFAASLLAAVTGFGSSGGRSLERDDSPIPETIIIGRKIDAEE